MADTGGTTGFFSRMIFWGVLAALCLYGMFFIYSTGYIGDDFPVRAKWERQLLFLLAGAGVCWGVSHLDYHGKAWELSVRIGYALGLAGLVLVLFFGVKVGGARRWLSLGGLPFQPAEFAKLFTLLLAAQVLARVKRLAVAVGLVALVALPPFVLIALEPSYGNALSLLPPLGMMLLFCCAGNGWLRACLALAFLLACAFLGTLLYLRSEDGQRHLENWKAQETVCGLRPYHLKRIRNYLDARGAWNERQSLVTVASGGLEGKGYLQGTMKSLGFLPRTVAPTDFIFAVICEEMGFLYGSLPVILLYMLLFAIGLLWASRAHEKLGCLLDLAVVMLLFTHVMVNVGMVIRLLPVMGLPLPLLSYGGSYALATMAALGVLLAVNRHADVSQQGTASTVLAWGHLLGITIHRK